MNELLPGEGLSLRRITALFAVVAIAAVMLPTAVQATASAVNIADPVKATQLARVAGGRLQVNAGIPGGQQLTAVVDLHQGATTGNTYQAVFGPKVANHVWEITGVVLANQQTGTYTGPT